MLRVTTILGEETDARYARRRVEVIAVDAVEATKRRLRRTSTDGVDTAIDLPRGSFLADGAVLADDGHRIIVVRRTPEDTLIGRFDPELPVNSVIASAARLGHAFGNQHIPIEIENGEVRIPVRTSLELVRRTAEALHLDGVAFSFTKLALGRHQRLDQTHAHAGSSALE